MFHQLVASKQRGMDGGYSEWLMLSCSQSSIKVVTTGLEVVLQILSAMEVGWLVSVCFTQSANL